MSVAGNVVSKGGRDVSITGSDGGSKCGIDGSIGGRVVSIGGREVSAACKDGSTTGCDESVSRDALSVVGPFVSDAGRFAGPKSGFVNSPGGFGDWFVSAISTSQVSILALT